MRWIALLLLFVPSYVLADPPKVEPEKVAAKAGDWIPFSAVGEKGKTVVRDADSSQVAFITDDDGQRYIVVKPAAKGTIVVRFWHAGDTVKLPGKAPLPSLPVATLTIELNAAQPPPKKPDDPKQPPTPTGYYFMLIRPDGAADPSFTKVARDPAWQKLKDAGHRVKDFGTSDLNRLGLVLPSGTTLPCVVTLYDDGKASRIVRGPIDLPATSEAILELPKGVGQ